MQDQRQESMANIEKMETSRSTQRTTIDRSKWILTMATNATGRVESIIWYYPTSNTSSEHKILMKVKIVLLVLDGYGGVGVLSIVCGTLYWRCMRSLHSVVPMPM
eukprot:249955_1